MENIFDGCLLSRLTISTWKPKITDKIKSEEAALAGKASTDAIKVMKSLLPKKYEKEITAIISSIRGAYYKYSLPYEDGSYRIVTPKAYDYLLINTNDLQIKFEKMADDIAFEYPLIKADAPNRLGDFYDEEDWPVDIRGKFKMNISMFPLPRTENVNTMAWGKERAEQFRRSIESDIQDRIDVAVKDNWNRLKETLEWLGDLMNEDGKDRILIREDTIDRLRNNLDLYEALNFTNDETMTQFIETCRADLCQYNVHQLRAHSQARDYIKERTKDIVGAMGGLW